MPAAARELCALGSCPRLTRTCCRARRLLRALVWLLLSEHFPALPHPCSSRYWWLSSCCLLTSRLRAPSPFSWISLMRIWQCPELASLQDYSIGNCSLETSRSLWLQCSPVVLGHTCMHGHLVLLLSGCLSVTRALSPSPLQPGLLLAVPWPWSLLGGSQCCCECPTSVSPQRSCSNCGNSFCSRCCSFKVPKAVMGATGEWKGEAGSVCPLPE